jgi:hypothetical protein
MARTTRQTAQAPPPGAGWRYNPKTRGWRNTRTGETLSRRQYDERYGRLARRGIPTPEAQARQRRAAGEAPGPARGRKGQRLLRRLPAIVYDETSASGWRKVDAVAVNKRTASLLGEYWARVQGETAFGRGDPAAFKRRFDRRVIRDIVTGERYQLVGDLDLLLRGYDMLTEDDQQELWEVLYEKRWSGVA